MRALVPYKIRIHILPQRDQRRIFKLCLGILKCSGRNPIRSFAVFHTGRFSFSSRPRTKSIEIIARVFSEDHTKFFTFFSHNAKILGKKRGKVNNVSDMYADELRIFTQKVSKIFNLLFYKDLKLGLVRIELTTSRLSGVRSNQLSYRPHLKKREGETLESRFDDEGQEVAADSRTSF